MNALSNQPWRLVGSASVCRLRSTRSTTRVRLSAGARWEILRVLASTTDRDGKESGGLLLGSARSDLMEVMTASGPGQGTVRDREFFRPDFAGDLDLADSVRSESHGRVQAIGTWHCHPGGSRLPSDADLELWSCLLDGWHRTHLVSVIAVRSGTGWDFVGFSVVEHHGIRAAYPTTLG